MAANNQPRQSMRLGKQPGRPGLSRNNFNTLKRLFSYITGKYKTHLFIVGVTLLVSSVAGVVGSVFLQTLIDDYITPLAMTNNPDFSGLFRVILKMASIYMTGVIATFLLNQIMVIITQGVMRDIRDDLFSHMQKLPIKYFDTHSHGDIMSHYTNDIDTLRQMISQSLPNFVSSTITILSVFVAMLSISFYMTLVVLFTLFIMFNVVKKIGGNSRKYFVRQQQSLGRTNGYIEEMIEGQKVIKVFNHEEETKAAFDRLNEELAENATQAHRFANILMPIMANIGYLQYSLVGIAGGTLGLLGIGSVTLGSIASFLQLSRNLSGPVNHISQQLNSVVMALAGAERIFNLLDEEHETDEGYVTLVNAKYDENGKLIETEERTGIWAWKHPHRNGTLTYTRLEGDVRFYDVDFGYNENEPVLHDITLYAEPGQKVALVGATGAGKTTITNLINRFYDITDGKIRYDGINIKKIKKEDLRRSLGIVLQDTHLFTGTVMENIRYGKLDATDEEVYEAAKLARAHDFIMMLPEGYQTVLTGDGAGLSQGQRQLLSIARAAIADPPVMILDEATSSIDTRTETLVQKGMDNLMHGRTVFVIAHRLSTIQNSDVIMVMDHGRIIERGNHEQLIAKKGRYYQLYTGAFELE